MWRKMRQPNRKAMKLIFPLVPWKGLLGKLPGLDKSTAVSVIWNGERESVDKAIICVAGQRGQRWEIKSMCKSQSFAICLEGISDIPCEERKWILKDGRWSRAD